MPDAARAGSSGHDAPSAQLTFDAPDTGRARPTSAIAHAGDEGQPGSSTAEHRVDPDQWDTAVAPTGRPQIVVGGPGTGKTEFLCRRIAAAITSGLAPERVLAVAFSRSGANDIRERLNGLVGPSAYRVVVGTYHSLARQLVEHHAADLGWHGVPSILTGVEQERLVAELLSSENPDDWSPVTRNLLGSPVMAAEITDFILRSSEQRMDPEDIAALDRPPWAGIPAFVARYDLELRDRQRVDYGRLLMQAATLAENRPSISEEFSLVVADEYQDTSPVQSAFLLAMASSAGDLTVAADPYQSIYSFRGTDIDNVFSFPRDTQAALGTRAERLILTTSFRVPTEILDAAVSVTARELPGGAGRVRSSRTTGSVVCHEFSTTGTEAEWIASDIERIHLVEGVPLERIAVFIRSKTSFIDELARALDRRHIDHSHADERLSEEPIIRFVNDLVIATAFHDEDESAAALRRVLLGPVVSLPNGMVGELPDDRGDRSAWVAGIPGCAELGELLGDDSWARSCDAASGLWRVWSTLPQLASVATDPDRDRDRAAWSAQAQVMTRIADRSPETTLLDHVEQTSRFDFEADPLYSVHVGEGVTMATLHRAKGTEFDVVYIADAVEGQLPDLRQRDSLLGVRYLNPHLPPETADYVTFRLDEERRLAYTAMTRSTTRVVWTATVASESGAGRSPSRFMRLVGPSTRPTFDERPLTPRSLVASLRRRMVDPSASDVDRLAAARFLAATSAEAFDPLDSYGVRERGDDTGTVPDDLRLSPSQAVRYRACPRAFAIERYLLTTVEESVYMRFGTLVHKVVEATERTAIEAGRPRGTIADALRTLDDVWDDRGLGSDTVGMAWKHRAAAMLRDLYERWPSDGVPVSLEVDLPLELGGVSWLGRADRIEREGETLTVVDYKTGSAASLADAAVSLQLGYYLLAARDHEHLAQEGRVDAAVFWHPKQIAYGKVTTRWFDMDNIDTVRDDLIAIADAIRSEQFDPTPGSHCRTCPAIAICPAQPIGVEAFIA